MLPNTSNNSLTTSERDAALWEENEKWARTVLPAMVFIGILMVIGILGNTLVVIIYGFRFKQSTQNFLIMCLACFDLLMGAIAMPCEIVDLRFHFEFQYTFFCKLMTSFSTFMTYCSVLTLLTIAIDRHRRVTKPLTKQMSIIEAKRYVLFNISIAFITSIPSWIITGLRKRKTQIPGLYGSDCSFSEQIHNTEYPLIYNMFLATLFLTFSSLFGFLYFTIWKHVKAHKKQQIKKVSFRKKSTPIASTNQLQSSLLQDIETYSTDNFSKDDGNPENVFENERLALRIKKVDSGAPLINNSPKSDLKPVSRSKSNEQGSPNSPELEQCLKSRNDSIVKYANKFKRKNTLKHTELNNSSSVYTESKPIHRKNNFFESLYFIYHTRPLEHSKPKVQGSHQTTKVAFAVTIIFILSFVPFLTLMFIRAFDKNFYDNLQGTALWIYNIFARFYLFNSALNPIVYGLLNEKFRLECKKIGYGCVSCIHSVIEQI